MTPPCKNCDDREIGCHGKCAKYATYKAGLEKAREKQIEHRIIADEKSRIVCKILKDTKWKK